MYSDLNAVFLKKLKDLKQDLRRAKMKEIMGKPIEEVDKKLQDDIDYYEELIKYIYGKI